MGYLSCRADSSISTCRSISSVTVPHSQSRNQQDTENNENRHIRKFNYEDIATATNNFSDAFLLGRGSHGSVYKAVLHNRPIAVKRPQSRRNEVDNEIHILSHIHNPRLVNLLGFTPNQPRLLVVEFMPNGTLYDFLHSNPRPPSFSRRLRLALQTSKALHSLHSSSPPLIHRDVKSANILIDRNFNARLSDFGLALRLITPSCRSTPPAGTLGYLDPSYVTPDNLSTKTDVFSFGILLFEMMSGRKAIDVAHSPPSVVEWAVPLLRKGKVSAIYDARVSQIKDSGARRQLAVLAASCVRSCDDKRPSMEQVVEQLKVLSKAVNHVRAWNGPCSAVETERSTISVGGSREEKMGSLRNGGRRSRNLMEFLARPDGEEETTAGGRSSVIGRARNVPVARDYYDRNGKVRLRRDQTVNLRDVAL